MSTSAEKPTRWRLRVRLPVSEHRAPSSEMRPRPSTPLDLTVASWNLLFRSKAESTLAYLDEAAWDIACLQEVDAKASDLLSAREGWSVVSGLRLAWNDGISSWKWPHGAAIVARNGWRLEEGAVIADTPTPGRGVTASAKRGSEAVSVISWHAPNRAGQGLETKMAGYRAMIAAVRGIEGPLIVGMDANHGSSGLSLDPCAPDPGHEHAIEIRFFSSEPGHALSDALLVYLRDNPTAYQQICRDQPDGPLAITYTHGRTPDRYDYLMISPEFDVAAMVHDYDGALMAGSDHGFVAARLRRMQSRPIARPRGLR